MTHSLKVSDSSAGDAEVTSQAATVDETGANFARHVELRTVVLDELKVVFLPVPKGGCTSMLWLLSKLAGIPPETFLHSILPGGHALAHRP